MSSQLAVSRGFSLFFLPWFLRPSKLGGPRSLVLGITLGFSLSLSLTGLAFYARDAWKKSLRRKTAKQVVEIRSGEIADGVEGLIGEGLFQGRSDGSSAYPLNLFRQHTFGTNQIVERAHRCRHFGAYILLFCFTNRRRC